jgi:ABC-type multidrug transport system ATPase subunit
MSHRSVILTTHSMEEAEVLCKRISIMVKGQVYLENIQYILANSFF